METSFAFYNKIFFEYADLRTAAYFMMGTPLSVALVLISYWLFIKRIGPAWMKNRPPYDVKWIMQAYNLLQVTLCGLFFCRTFYLFITNEVLNEDSRLLCMYHNRDSEYHWESMFLAWAYFMLKIIDLLDTVFFVLRKKFNQVTTLHTYHHTMMIICTYATTRYYPGGTSHMITMCNCLVHAFMYSYYFYCAYDTSASKSIWWKKYITQLQLIQFCVFLVWFTPQLFLTDCEYSKIIVFMFFSQALTMLVMFGRYYYKAFIKPIQTFTKNQ